ncbi:serine acetyltransferase [Luteolibacter ambystomatis]|uniref:Serine acetyltransferase n=1 Tax=Luteolibacter ambystomatis TaxID=2824561 RepID=A0A975J1L9_9BACT|nr:serine acetyltransferase [Luteolibacter ambystomatis]
MKRDSHSQTEARVEPDEQTLAILDHSFDPYVVSLLASYEKMGGLNITDSLNTPSKRAVGEICRDLLQILFPGFHDNDSVAVGSLEMVTRARLTSVIERLADQVRKSVRIGNPNVPTGRTPPIMQRFCKALSVVRELLRTDIEAAYAADPAASGYDEIILAYPYIEAIAIQRLAHRLYRLGAPIIPRMMTEWAHSRTGIDIHPGARIGLGFFIDHGTGVVIGETCVIGNHVKLYHGVTLGARSFAKDDAGNVVRGTRRHPHVEDNVTIFPNSTILGGDTRIGANSTIGANVFLMKSVPPNTLVIYEEKQLSFYDKLAKKVRSNGLDFSI